MKRLTYSLCFCLFAVFAVPSLADAAWQNTYGTVRTTSTPQRASYGNYVAANRNIKSIPLLSRPDRPGHFIGNSIRRANRRRGGR